MTQSFHRHNVGWRKSGADHPSKCSCHCYRNVIKHLNCRFVDWWHYPRLAFSGFVSSLHNGEVKLNPELAPDDADDVMERVPTAEIACGSKLLAVWSYHFFGDGFHNVRYSQCPLKLHDRGPRFVDNGSLLSAVEFFHDRGVVGRLPRVHNQYDPSDHGIFRGCSALWHFPAPPQS